MACSYHKITVRYFSLSCFVFFEFHSRILRLEIFWKVTEATLRTIAYAKCPAGVFLGSPELNQRLCRTGNFPTGLPLGFLTMLYVYLHDLFRCLFPLVLKSPIAHFPVSLCLCFKTSLSAKPFLWKCIEFAWKWTCRQNAISYEWFRS